MALELVQQRVKGSWNHDSALHPIAWISQVFSVLQAGS